MSNIIIGTVTGREIKKNRDGDKNVLMLQCTFQEDDDTQSVELITQAGEDTNPPDGSTVIIVDAGDSYKIGVAVDDGIEPTVNEGEKKFYSIDSGGNILSSVLLNSSGEFVINDGTKHAARKDDAVRVTIPAGTFIVSVSGGSGAPAVGALNPLPIDVDGTIIEGTNEVLLP